MGFQREPTDLRETSDVPELPKKEYSSPELTTHGTVERITGLLASAAKDAGMGSTL